MAGIFFVRAAWVLGWSMSDVWAHELHSPVIISLIITSIITIPVAVTRCTLAIYECV